MAISVHSPKTVLKGERNKDPGDVVVNSILKRTRGYQAVERSGMSYFFLLARVVGIFRFLLEQ